MILFLTLLYIGVLLLLFKLNVLKPTLFWKLSPIVWSIFLLIVLFFPLQFWAPSGPLVAGHYTVSIIPRVAGEVTEVYAVANKPIKKGDVLFQIDPIPYRAVVSDAEGGVKLAQIRVTQEENLSKKGVGKALDLERTRAQLIQNQAKYDKARYDLDATTVRAPADGYATNIALRAGSRVVSFPFQPAMAYVESGELLVGALIMQNHLRYIEAGQRAEIAFKISPGKVYAATVINIIPSIATGFESPTGLPVVPQEIVHAPFAVRLQLGKDAEALNLPSGATGRVAIYSSKGTFTHIIRMVDLRIESIINYVNPF